MRNSDGVELWGTGCGESWAADWEREELKAKESTLGWMLLGLWEGLGLGSSGVTMETALELSRGSSSSFACQPSVATVKYLLCLWRP